MKQLLMILQKTSLQCMKIRLNNILGLHLKLRKRATEVMSTVLAKKDGFSEEDLENDNLLKEKYTTLADRDIRQGGYKIHSTINKEIYDRMQEVAQNFPYYGSDRYRTVTDPETGESKTVSRAC